jgi:hypothetical protein
MLTGYAVGLRSMAQSGQNTIVDDDAILGPTNRKRANESTDNLVVPIG